MGKEIQVLVLDDEENILRAVKRLFIDEPYDVYTTVDPEEAMRILSETKIKVVMSDQRMPRISGVEFLSKVKKQSPNVVRLLFTGYADMQAAEDAINKGEVFRFINKPWDDHELKVILRQAIERFDLVEENIELTKEIKRQNEELKEANERLKVMYEKEKKFTSTVSHELRTPLASIKMALDMIATEAEGKFDDDGKLYLNIAKKSVDRLARLVSDILSLSKLETGAEPLKMKEGDINALIREVVTIHKPVAEKKGLLMSADLDDALGLLLINADKISQVLNNLVNNAIKFTETGSVTIMSRFLRDEKLIRVSIQDTGSGISQEDIPKLFKKFQQLKNPVSNVEGTGLGLAICKEIIAQHGGQIWIESEPGKGSSFIFTLPVQS